MSVFHDCVFSKSSAASSAVIAARYSPLDMTAKLSAYGGQPFDDFSKVVVFVDLTAGLVILLPPAHRVDRGDMPGHAIVGAPSASGSLTVFAIASGNYRQAQSQPGIYYSGSPRGAEGPRIHP